MKQLQLENLHKSFGETLALAGISFNVTQGEIIAVLGPSGCGKSTLLSVIAGLEPPDYSRVLWEGNDLAETPPHQRGFGLMFQDFALFPHKNVHDNVAFGPQMAGLEASQIKVLVEQALTLIGLPGFAARDVNTLSGGEQQRVALARSLAPQPRLLMLDEPLGALDRSLRARLLAEMGVILRAGGQTTLYVTHDQSEAFAIADRVVVMNAGAVAQIGAPQHIYQQPASLFVAEFLGLDNILSGTVRSVDHQYFAETEIGELPIPPTDSPEVAILLRPDAMRLDHTGNSELQGRVTARDFRGATTQIEIDINQRHLHFEFLSSQTLPQIGEIIHLSYNLADAIQILD
ncbi:MAG: ABC transporter ATP-binding protein [Chloroflexi bacterium]|nr:ABC transporter ATP-binding protein [Chloroflexota bacterium]